MATATMGHKKTKARSAEAPVAAEEASAEDQLLRAGREAADAYDYDLARDRFLAAFEAHGSEGAAIALLQLLVDHLAADDEALALGARLSATASKHPEVRALLALSAARRAQRERAVRLVKDQEGPRAAEVFVALARAALADADHEQATRDLAEARRRDPAHAELLGLADAIAARRADERTPLEAELARLAAEGRLDEAEARAGAILARWPESETARRTLGAVEEQKKARRAEALLRQAEQALERGETAVALSAARQALATGGLPGPDAERARGRVAEMEAAQRAEEARAAADETARLFQESALLPAFLAYLALDDGARGLVRAQLPLAPWSALDETGAQGPGAKPRAAALAIVALQRAGEIAVREPGAALEILAPHDAILRNVSPARALTGEARRLLAERRRDAARSAAAEARAALESGAPERGDELLTDQVLRDLPDGERGPAEELRARLRDAAELHRRAAEVERLRQRGALFAARDEAGTLAARSSGAERARWTETRAAVQAEIQRAFHVHVFPEPEPFGGLDGVASTPGGRPLRTLVPGTTELVLVQARGPWVFLRVVDLAARVVRARVVLRAPEAFEVADAEVDAGRVVITGTPPCVLSIARGTWEVEGWYAMPETRVDARVHAHVGDVVPIAGGRLLWVDAQIGDRPPTLYVVDVARSRVIREIEVQKHAAVRALAGPGEARVCLHESSSSTLPLYDARGILLERYEAPFLVIHDGVAAMPDGRGLFLLAGNRPSWTRDAATTYGWRVLPRGAAPGPLSPLDGLGDLSPVVVAVDRAAHRIFVQATLAGGDTLVGLDARSAGDTAGLDDSISSGRESRKALDARRAADTGGLAPLFRVDLPPRTRLVQDPESGRTVALCPEATGVRVVPLGAEAPDVPTGPAPHPFSFPSFTGIQTGCYLVPARDDPSFMALTLAVSADARSLPRRIEAAKAQDDPQPMLELARILQDCGWDGEASKLIKRAYERHPEHPVVRLHKAGMPAAAGRWREVKSLLAGLDLTPLDARRAMHCHHLLASAHLMLGAPDRAWEVLTAAAAYPGICRLDPLRALACPEARADAPPPADLGPDGLSVYQLVAATRAADACLLRDDAQGAVDLLEAIQVWECGEVQSLARLAEAYLRLPDDGPYRKALALATYANAHGEAVSFRRRELPLPDARRDKAQLDSLAEQARAWLEGALP